MSTSSKSKKSACCKQNLVLFSPAIILVIWAFFIVIDGHIGRGWTILFLGVLAVSVGAAEFVRYKIRTDLRKEIREQHRRVAHS